MSEENKATMPWFKWHVKDVINYREVFTTEQIGELFLAAMKTVETGERIEVSSEIKFAYLQLCTDISEARTAYLKKCETNAKNGAKGGKTKAENAKTKENGFKPPTKTEFKTMAKSLANSECICCDSYDFDKGFEFFVNANWTVDGEPISDRTALECAVCAYLEGSYEMPKLLKALLSSDKAKGKFDLSDFYNLFKFYDPPKKLYKCNPNDPFSQVFHNASDFVEWWFRKDEE